MITYDLRKLTCPRCHQSLETAIPDENNDNAVYCNNSPCRAWIDLDALAALAAEPEK